jgi:hypothetical protein
VVLGVLNLGDMAVETTKTLASSFTGSRNKGGTRSSRWAWVAA